MQTIIEIRDVQYKVLRIEKEYLFHPVAIGICEPKDGANMECGIHVELENYRMTLSSMWFVGEANAPMINGVIPKSVETDGKQTYSYEKLDIPLTYTGSILMGATLIRSYEDQEGESPAYAYKKVLEYIFENGILITTIDHSRAMNRVRKNIDLGYRSLSKFRDRKCIDQFLKSSFIGTYRPVKNLKKKTKLLEELYRLYWMNPKIQIEEQEER